MLNKERQQYACVQQIGVIYLAPKLQKGGSLYIAKGYGKFPIMHMLAKKIMKLLFEIGVIFGEIGEPTENYDISF